MIRPDLEQLPTYVQGAQSVVKSAPPLKLSSNEAAVPPPPSVLHAMTQALSNTHRYPDMGAWALRTALAERLGMSVQEMAVGTGSSALCQQLVTITCAPSDEVLFAWRSFEAYPIFARVAGATPVQIPVTAEGKHDLDAMAAAITERTRLVFLCNPNNPTGQTIGAHEFTRFMDRVPHNVIVALDEAYVEYNMDADSVRGIEAVRNYPNLVVLRTFSKAYGLAGTRVGYAFGPAQIIDALNKVAAPFSVSAVAQAAALASLEAADEVLEHVKETVTIRDHVADSIGALRSHGNFVWFPTPNAHHLTEQLREKGVLVRPFPEGLRITVTNTEEAEVFLSAWRAITTS